MGMGKWEFGDGTTQQHYTWGTQTTLGLDVWMSVIMYLTSVCVLCLPACHQPSSAHSAFGAPQHFAIEADHLQRSSQFQLVPNQPGLRWRRRRRRLLLFRRRCGLLLFRRRCEQVHGATLLQLSVFRPIDVEWSSGRSAHLGKGMQKVRLRCFE
jgi:hypothetical protein